MKKLTALILSVLMVLTLLTACGGSSKSVAMEPQAAPALKGDYAMEEFALEAPAAMDTAATRPMRLRSSWTPSRVSALGLMSQTFISFSS